MRNSSALVLCLFFFSLSGAFGAEGAYPKVRSVAGSAEILEPTDRQWKTLLKDAVFRKGSAVRTGADGAVEIAFDAGLNDVLKLGPDSRMNLLNPKDEAIHFSLGKGTLFVLREREGPSRPRPLTILTRHFLVEMQLGGSSLETSERRTVVRVFSESLRILDLNGHHPFGSVYPERSRGTHGGPRSAPRVIAEGLKCFSGVSGGSATDRRRTRRRFDGGPAVVRRLAYADYGQWKLWMKEMYTAQDDRAVDYLEKISG